MQLAAYTRGFNMPLPGTRGINVFVGVNDCQVQIHEWSDEDLVTAWAKFSLLLGYWQLDKNYFPGLGVKPPTENSIGSALNSEPIGLAAALAEIQKRKAA